jgi:hypothetical protein
VGPQNGVVFPQSTADDNAAHLRAVVGINAGEPEGSRRVTWQEPESRPTIRDTILTVIQPGEEVSAGVVLERLTEAGFVTNRDTVSNELSRWAHEGKLERPVRGTYRAVIVTDPARDHEPLAAQDRPDDQEGMSDDAVTRTTGAIM